MLISFVLNTGAELVGKKWRAVIIWYLKDGPCRFSELKKLIPDISVKMLSQVLKEMEENVLITRIQYSTIPVKVTYEIHKDAEAFLDANIVSTIRIAEYILQNAVRLDVPAHILAELVPWVQNNRVFIDTTKDTN
jgi:DNA-binding HxlR family transcriptional regulator